MDKKVYTDQLQKKPSHSKYKNHYWADYIEMLCIANVDGEISKSDLVDRLSERERDLHEGTSSDFEEIIDLENESDSQPTQRCRIDEKWTDRVDSWFQVLQFRHATYKENYPFKLESDEIVFSFNNQNGHQKHYLYFLFCSNLYLFDRVTSNILSSSFEVICLQVLKNMLPQSAVVKLFGSNQLNEDPKYGKQVNCLNKIKNLADDLNERIGKDVNEEGYPATNFGDDGLDLVAWIPSGDNQPSKIIYFGQCACTSDWISKQSSSSYEAWSNKISLTNYPTNMVFIPFCYRNYNGEWFKLSDIRKSFLLDRLRLINYLDSTNDLEQEINALLDSVISCKEPIF